MNTLFDWEEFGSVAWRADFSISWDISMTSAASCGTFTSSRTADIDRITNAELGVHPIPPPARPFLYPSPFSSVQDSFLFSSNWVKFGTILGSEDAFLDTAEEGTSRTWGLLVQPTHHRPDMIVAEFWRCSAMRIVTAFCSSSLSIVFTSALSPPLKSRAIQQLEMDNGSFFFARAKKTKGRPTASPKHTSLAISWH